MIKIILSILILCCIAYLGYGIERYYKIRLAIINEYVDFLRYASREIEFLKTNIIDLINKYPSKVKQFDLNISDESSINIDSKYLTKEVNQSISSFFDKLTTTDYNSRSNLLNHSIEVAEQYRLVAEKEKIQKGELSRKLCILAGIGLLILSL